MADQSLPHKLSLDMRKLLRMDGVTEVISFDESTVLLKTTQGELVVQGANLQLKTLDAGNVVVEGQITALAYAQPRQGGSWLSRLFS